MVRNFIEGMYSYRRAKEVAKLEWILAGSPPAQKAEYEARIQKYKEYPPHVLEAEEKRLLAIYQQEDHLFINPQEEEAFKREQLEQKQLELEKFWEETRRKILPVWERQRLERLDRERRHLPLREQIPLWRLDKEQYLLNLEERERAKEQTNPANISTDAAPHIGIREIPAGSTDTISHEDIEDGDEMVELHGDPKHIFKKSMIDEWISSRKKQFPRNPIKNPYTNVIIKQEDIKRYTAKLKAKAKNGGKRGYNETRRKYGGYKKSKSLRMRHKVTRSRRR